MPLLVGLSTRGVDGVSRLDGAIERCHFGKRNGVRKTTTRLLVECKSLRTISTERRTTMLSQSVVLVDKPTFLRRLEAGTRRSSRVRRWHAATRDVEQNYPPSLERLICSFRAVGALYDSVLLEPELLSKQVPDPLLRYKQLLFLAKKLPPFPAVSQICN